jgi:hypothetical protein
MLSLGMMGGAGLFGALENATAMGTRPIIEGMRRVTGEVRVNGALALVGAPVTPDGTVSTGVKSRAVFMVGKNANEYRDPYR